MCRFACGLPVGCSSRSHTAYAVPAFVGFALTDSLSLKNCVVGSLSAMSSVGALQVWPPSVETDAATALLLFDWLNEIDTEYAVPSGPIDTHGSDARSYARPPAHALNGRFVCFHVRPPSNE